MMHCSRRLRSAVTVLGLIVGAVGLTAQPPVPTPFRFERPVAARSGPQRLKIDVPLLSGGTPFRVGPIRSGRGEGAVPRAEGGLRDLRLFDSSGREVGYLLVQNRDRDPIWKPPASVAATAPIETDTVKSTGFEADFGSLMLVDRLRVDGIAPPFLKRVHVEGSGDRSHWTVLVDEATVFDLPDIGMRQIELAFAPGSFRYLRLTWDDSRSARVRPPARVAVREATPGTSEPPLRVPLAFERRPSEPRSSRFRVRLPAARLPVVALELDVDGGRILRTVDVFEGRLAGPEVSPSLIGHGTLKRVEQDAVVASALRVAIQPPSESELELLVDDGDNGRLELKGVSAVFAELPWIYLESDGGGLTARYGNPSLTAPNYDLEALRPELDLSQVPEGSWGDARERTAAENGGTMAPPLPVVGADIDAASFRYLRDVPSGDAGLIAVRLDEAVLAHSSGVSTRFGDVRVIDAQGRQIPYVVERVSEPLSIDVTLEKVAPPPAWMPAGAAARSVYRMRWPYAGLPPARLVLTTTARVFSRAVEVAIQRPADRRRRDPGISVLASTMWIHADQERPAPALTIPIHPIDQTDVYLIVHEGDNTSLDIATARLLLPSYRLRLFREAGAPLRIAYGRPDLPPPTYDLTLLSRTVLGASALELTPEGERKGSADTAAASLVSPRVFWAILGLGVLALLVMIARLLKRPAV